MAETVISEDSIGLIMEKFEELLSKKIEGLASKDDVKKLESSQNEARNILSQSIGDLEKQFNQSIVDIDRRFKARESFPPPPNGIPPESDQVVVQGSVSKPVWRNTSIFG